MTQADKSIRKIMIFIYSMGNGGAERVAANLANYWAAKGWSITIVTLSKQHFDFYELHPRVKRISLDLASESRNILDGLWQNVRRVVALRRLLRGIQPEIALGMMTTSNIMLALAAWGLPNVHTIGSEHIHPTLYPLSYTWKFLRSKVYGLLNAVTALTSEGENWLKNNTNAKSVLLIPNAVTWPLPEHEPRISPRAFCQPNKQILLAVGRLDEQKGFDWLIEVFSNLAHKHPNWDLIILGEGPLRTILEKQVRESGLEKRIFLPGRVGNLSEWYESADLFVMSSRYEGFGNTLVEAMAYGLPAVSFDCDAGPRDIINHGLNGLLVPPCDLVALTSTLDNIMRDDALRLQLAERTADVREQFSMKGIASLWEQLFDKLLYEPNTF
jgi:glycosyltransferase involved in cell wall biosynthesis